MVANASVGCLLINYPLKQGLKRYSYSTIGASCLLLLINYPLKQGLKRCDAGLICGGNGLLINYPLKQGLKRALILQYRVRPLPSY